MSHDKATADFGYFTRLAVENVRCFASRQELDLTNPDGAPAKWTILLGNNGTGKTTLLQCLVAVEPVSDTRILPGTVLGTGARAGRAIRWPTPDGISYGEALARDPSRRLWVQGTLTFGVPLTSAAPTIDVGNYWDGPHRSGGTQHPHMNLNMFLCAYGASRKPAAASLTGTAQSAGNTATLFDESATLLSPEEWLLQADYAAKSAPDDLRVRQRFEQIREALVELLEGITAIRVAGPDDRSTTPRAEARTPFGWVRVRELSLGYRTLMTWVVDFAQRLFARYPESKDPLAEPAVCLVDEIDLHLHPRWQRKLIGYLDKRFPRTQFIVTAHSPLVVQAAEKANIAVLERHDPDDFITIHNDREAVRGWRIDQILTSELFGLEGSRSPKINTLMQARRRILGQPELSGADREQLQRIEAELQELPEGEMPEDQAAWDVVHRFATLLRQRTGTGRG